MNQTHDDTRATAYVFGELSAEQLTAFERELEVSLELRQEVASIREAVAAVRGELQAAAVGVSPAHRRVIEQAIQQRTQQTVSPAPRSNADHEETAAKRRAIVAFLAASVVLVAGLSFPYWQPQLLSKSESSDTGSTDNTLTGMDILSPSTIAESSAPRLPAVEMALGMEIDRRVDTLLEESYDGERSQLGAARSLQSMDGIQTLPIDSAASNLSRRSRRLADESSPAAEPQSNRPAIDSLDSVIAESGDADSFALVPESGAMTFQSDASTLKESTSEELRGSNLSTLRVAGRSVAGGAASSLGDDLAENVSETLDVADRAGLDVSTPLAAGGTRDHYLRESGQGLRGGTTLLFKEEQAEREVMLRHSIANERETIDASGDRYASIQDNAFVAVADSPLSTFSVDVDTASYSKVRSLLRNHSLPRPDAVRIEEMLNYFDYDYPAPQGEHPFAASMEIAQCPWNSAHRLARIGIRAKEIDTQRPHSNLVFLLDVSGSMDEPDKLPLVIEGMKLLTDQLTENDKVAIVVYAGAAGVVLDATRGDKKQIISEALDRLRAGGSTNGGQGIVLAYQIARDHFIKGATNRVILCSDGDFNVGVTGTDELVRIAKENARTNIFLSVLGFGTGNHNDEMMEKISNEGNGNYAFIDSRREAEKVFVEELGGTLVTVAKDVKIQIEFNPSQIASYRLIGYENRMLQARDFADDRKDAGEIGAGHTVTALYELVPAGSEPESVSTLPDLRYQTASELTERAESNEALVLKLRYKQPEGETSTLMEVPVVDEGKQFQQCDRDFQFATAVAGFGMLLRQSPHCGSLTFDDVQVMARESAKGDDFGYRTEFLELIDEARQLRGE